MSAELLDRARGGDEVAFADLVAPHRRELHVHCYRILGSVADADDALQETLLSAWQALPAFEERSSLRTWLYRIATSRCLNQLRAGRRRPQRAPNVLPAEARPPAPTRLNEITWLEPYPDLLLDELADPDPTPEALITSRESISLAFVTALQILPPRQRAVLILRDVLDFSAREVAEMLETTEQSVTSALKRARATVHSDPARTNPEVEQDLVDRLVTAFETGDVPALVALLTEDARLSMPPVPLEYEGRDLVGEFFSVVAFRQGRRFRMVTTRANGQPALAVYTRDPHGGIAHAFGLLVIGIRDDKIATITRFDNAVIGPFGLPRTIAD
ncbi:MAG TPA: sigma-70 family RNA polymerase sigma factor [Mycobacteriales bacterium]|nr:sigma-70 family RNA polymerase sigma factor [Mycobacteriales bacterium]